MEEPQNAPQTTETSSLKAGTWDTLSTEESERHPSIKFELNVVHKISFLSGEPKEMPSRDRPGEVYYIFDVMEDDEQKVIMTSAWTLLRGLKEHQPLGGKTFNIAKKMNAGKQGFVVELAE